MHILNMDMNMDMDMDMNITINASEVLEFSSYLLSSFANADSNGSGSNVGADSEDSLICSSRKLAVPRQKINARERHRTFNVNAAYEELRGLIPTEPVNRKLSKIEIIHLASSYITHLRSTLHAGKDICG
ncbi:neurogenin-3 [Drosophila novamexicana]|uniref:neurogenin-3 n=1 Tax=Drosophila novamexicana TaxID=47314 RepID=UPI0011E5F0CE|nr:neurogenin-3 [Drosophila novamexicana]